LYLESVGGIGGDRAELAESVEDEMMKKDEKVDEGGNDGMGATMIQHVTARAMMQQLRASSTTGMIKATR